MIFYLIGIDYKIAPLSVREHAYLLRSAIMDFCTNSTESLRALFTCNRVELYGCTHDFHAIAGTVDALRNAFGSVFVDSYLKVGKSKVIRHALRLSCGLESQVLGEPQIMEQLYSWIKQDFFPLPLKEEWLKALSLAHTIRLQSHLSRIRRDISTLVLGDFMRRTHPKRQKEIVIVGTGKIAQLFVENRSPDTKLHFVSRKRHSRARRLARSSGGEAVVLDELASLSLTADALISATSSPHCVVREEHIAYSFQRPNPRLYLYDLAVPRDIDPKIGYMPGVSLWNIDDLGQLFSQHNRDLQHYIQVAESLIEREMKRLEAERDYDFSKNWNTPQCACVKAG